MTFVSDFLNFLVKECLFGSLDSGLELFPILDLFGRPIFIKIFSTVVILLFLEMFGNIDNF